LDDRGSVPFLGNKRNLSLRHCVQIGSEAHSAAYPLRTVDSFPEDKVAGHLVLRLRSRAGILPVTHMFSWRAT